tara:strand:+ start:2079 stop:3011 length:933 start_codon:yes stop_codon:yes gene_type:complete
MMTKKFLLIIVIFLFSITRLFANSDIYISVTVNDSIISNYDIKKEKSYLIILNPKLSNLEESKALKVAKNSLINEIIKEKELIKIFDLSKDISYLDQVLKDLYTKLNLKNQKELIELLKNKNTYSIDEIKKKLKIELLWNELIFKKFKNQVKINEKQLIKKIENESNRIQKEYFLSEILFKKEKNEDLELKIQKIESSINDVGFSNTANIFSISESANYGGKIGWILEANLSKLIAKELKKIEVGKYTEVIQIGNNFLFLKIEEIRTKKKSIDKKAQLKEMKMFETNRQLGLFSNIYFNKVKINYSINEK